MVNCGPDLKVIPLLCSYPADQDLSHTVEFFRRAEEWIAMI